MHARPALARTVGLVLDVAAVLAFVAIGRHTHHDGASLAGLWHTAWPFLAGLAIGLAASRAWRRPLAIVPAGPPAPPRPVAPRLPFPGRAGHRPGRQPGLAPPAGHRARRPGCLARHRR